MGIAPGQRFPLGTVYFFVESNKFYSIFGACGRNPIKREHSKRCYSILYISVALSSSVLYEPVSTVVLTIDSMDERIKCAY